MNYCLNNFTIPRRNRFCCYDNNNANVSMTKRKVRKGILYIIVLILSYWIFFAGPECFQLIQIYYLQRQQQKQKGRSDDTVYYHMLTDRELNRSIEIINTTTTSNYTTAVGAATTTTSNIQGKVVEEVQQVPKIFHRLWKSYDFETMPLKWINSYKRCKNLHPDYEIMLWTDKKLRNFIETNYNWFLNDYDSYKYDIQRIDSVRYFILYHYGGIYMDLDIGCKRKLEPIRLALSSSSSLSNNNDNSNGTTGRTNLSGSSNTSKKAMFPLTDPVGFSNDIMISTKKHPFFYKLMHSLHTSNKWYGSHYPTVLFSTGSVFVTLQYFKLSKIEQSMIYALSPKFYNSRNQTQRYFYHMKGSTWHQNDGEYITKFYWFNISYIYIFHLFLFFILFKVWQKRKRQRMNKNNHGKVR